MDSIPKPNGNALSLVENHCEQMHEQVDDGNCWLSHSITMPVPKSCPKPRGGGGGGGGGGEGGGSEFRVRDFSHLLSIGRRWPSAVC